MYAQAHPHHIAYTSFTLPNSKTKFFQFFFYQDKDTENRIPRVRDVPPEEILCAAIYVLRLSTFRMKPFVHSFHKKNFSFSG